jgi:hypothetical protein
MTWLREVCRALFDALIEHWRSPRRSRIVGGDDSLRERVRRHIRLRGKNDA